MNKVSDKATDKMRIYMDVVDKCLPDTYPRLTIKDMMLDIKPPKGKGKGRNKGKKHWER